MLQKNVRFKLSIKWDFWSVHLLTSKTQQTQQPYFGLVLNDNIKNRDGKRRILSIIANDFTYKELKTNLNVGVCKNN